MRAESGKISPQNPMPGAQERTSWQVSRLAQIADQHADNTRQGEFSFNFFA
jgi:hypothetical protein